jgi:hypothetical protein
MGPQVARTQPVRVGDAERDDCIAHLQAHYSQGRLTSDELSDRLDLALTARTDADLARLVVDLPPRAVPTRAAAPAKTRGWSMLIGLAALAVVLAATGGPAEGNSDPGEEYSYGSGICQATGLAPQEGADCPEVSEQQEELISDAEAAFQSAEQARAAAETRPEDLRVAKLADQAQAAAERAERAVTDGQIIVATAPGERPGKEAFTSVAQRAETARRDAARAALEAEYQAGNG